MALDTDPKAITHHIFHQTYLYAIPAYHRYSKQYNTVVGHLSSGDKVLDQNLMNEYVNVGGTIADILKLFEKGADVRFQTPQDLVTIYEVLVCHLNNWLTYIDRDPNIKDAPLESLGLMAEFAESIRPTVIGFKPKVEDVPRLKMVSSLFGGIFGAEALFNPTGVGIDVQETSPLVDRIERLLSQRNATPTRR